MNYAEFLANKTPKAQVVGVTPTELSPYLFQFQNAIVRWALRLGRAAIFADCGLGKTLMQLDWAKHTGERTLILAPLAVAEQTVREGMKFGIHVAYCRSQAQADDHSAAIIVTNYEMLHAFDPSAFGAVVLDESSILKSYDGKFRTLVIETFQNHRFRLACTATPAPNDHMELANHAEFLSIMRRSEMLATFFVHDGGETQKWRLKGHAKEKFWEWVASWAVMVRRPSDLGFEDNGFLLPSLNVEQHIVDSKPLDGTLFAMPAADLRERIRARQSSVHPRATAAAAIANATPGPVIIWCGLNAESDTVTNLIPGAVNVQGADALESKEKALIDFSQGKTRVLVTKPSIAGFGMNWQHCSTMIFLGLSDSWEAFYQATRRCWRFGQTNDVTAHIVISQLETSVLENVQRKDREATEMHESMTREMARFTTEQLREHTDTPRTAYATRVESGDGWTMMLGDAVEVCAKQETESVDYMIFSPPFADLYVYSDSERDIGNCRGHDEFAVHFGYLINSLVRILKPGRLVSVHCMNLPTVKQRDGVIGLRDFRGDIIRLFQSCGMIYHSEVCIWKDPVTAMQRTKAIGLLHKQIVKDSAMSRMGIPDYVCTFRKPGENQSPVAGELDTFVGDPSTFQANGRLSIDIWQRYASPIWTDIRQSRTLQRQSARADKDERHIAPLQLDVIERCLQLWTNPDDLVLSPFAGIGSEGFCAVQSGRRFLGVELKESYFLQAVANLRTAATLRHGPLFALEEKP